MQSARLLLSHLSRPAGLRCRHHCSPRCRLRFVDPVCSCSSSPSLSGAKKCFISSTRPIDWVPSKLESLSPSLAPRHIVFRSTSTDPYLNLAIENFLLTRSYPDSKIIFLYANRPCVVLGRNQNPWVECDLKALRRGGVVGHDRASNTDGGGATENGKAGKEGVEGEVLLVRRRSGGGTVFHDAGNLNYSVIVPNDAAFRRDKHAHMVVRGIQRLQEMSRQVQDLPDDYTQEDADELGRLGDLLRNKSVRVNDRNDIVMDLLPQLTQTLKISGTAFRLTRGRALHHGTLLYSSPNLNGISPFLRSPAREFISAKGVDSVRSPVGNLAFTEDLGERAKIRQLLEKEIISSFRTMYDIAPSETAHVGENDARVVEAIQEGREEIMRPGWRFEQTPSFVFSNRPVEGEENFHPPMQGKIPGVPEGAKVFFRVKNGILQEVDVSLSDDGGGLGVVAAQQEKEKAQMQSRLQGRKLHEINDWHQTFHGLDAFTHPSTGALIKWLSNMFPPLPAFLTVETELPNLATAGAGRVEQQVDHPSSDVDVKEDASLHQQPQYR